MLNPQSLQLRVGVDVGSQCHSVAVGLSDGSLLEEFEIPHTAAGFRDFFARIEGHAKRHPYPIAVAMEGYNGHVRPLDSLVRARGWRLFNVNNLKLARFKEIFPAAAKSDRIDSAKTLELFQLRDHLPMARRCASGSHGNARGERHPQAPVAAPAPLGERTGARASMPCRPIFRPSHRGFWRSPGRRQPLVLELSDLPQGLLQARPGAPRQPAQSALHRPHLRRSYPGLAEARLLRHDARLVGDMIQQDAARILELKQQIKALEEQMAHDRRAFLHRLPARLHPGLWRRLHGRTGRRNRHHRALPGRGQPGPLSRHGHAR